MNGSEKNLIFTSPPYNAEQQTEIQKKLQNINDSDNKTETEYLNF